MYINRKRRQIIRMSDLSWNIVLVVYMILALEYDLYNFFGMGFVISGTVLTMIEILLLLAAVLMTKHRVKAHYIMYLFLLLGIAGTYLFSPECSEYLHMFFWEGSSLKKVFLLPLAVQCINRADKFVDKLYMFSVIEGYIHIICNAIWGYGYTEWGVFNYMTYGMALITPTCLVMQRVFSRPTKWNVLTLTIFELNIILYGHRGALLVTIIMSAIFFLKYVKTTKKIYIGLAGAFVLLLLFIFKTQIIGIVIDLMQTFNLESRTLEKFLTGDITNDSERNIIWGFMVQGIIRNFPFGNGIGAERILLGNSMREGLYAHNFILEICYNYGAVIGGIVVISIFTAVYKSLKYIQDEEWYRLIVSFLVPSVLTLMTSASIYQYWMFWLSMGFYFCYFGRRWNSGNRSCIRVVRKRLKNE